MTLVEARTRLGLAPAGAIDRTELRRAYLQAIKRAKPEVDPEGFQTARAAYELLDGLLKMGMPHPEAPAVAVPPAPDAPAPAEAAAPEDGPAAEAEPAAADHLRPYRDKLNGLFGLPWQQRAEVGWEAYQAFPGDAAAREFLLELLPNDHARSDITALLLEGARANDLSCLIRLIQFAPAAVPDELLAALEARGGPLDHLQRFLVAQARVRRGQADQGMALLERVLENDGTSLPEPMLVEWTLGLWLQLEGAADPVRARQVRALLERYLGSPGLPADAATPSAAKLFALIGELEKASYLPPEVTAELARGSIEGQWQRLPGVLVEAERKLGSGTFERKLDRLRLESPALMAVVHAHRAHVVPTGGGSSGWWRIVLVVVALGGGRAVFQDCGSSSTPAITYEKLKENDPSFFKTIRLQGEVAVLCSERHERMLCGLLPRFLDRLGKDEPCATLEGDLRALRDQAGALALSEERQLDRIAAALPELCKK
jgi:hypothetical protein